MAEPVTLDRDATTSVGADIRAARQRAGRTLSDVAEAAGVSIGYLSQVERGQLTASVDALRRIAETLGLPAGGLAFAGAIPVQGRTGVALVPRDGRKSVTFGDRDISYEVLTPNLQGRFSVLMLDVPPGQESGPSFSHAGEDVVHVTAGVLDVEVGDVWHKVGPGDTLSFASELPHRWRNAGKSKARAIWISSPPWL